MGLEILETALNGLIVFKPNVFYDSRGFFAETYRSDEFEYIGLPTNFLQDNHSQSKKNILRGLHFQWMEPMGKLIRVIRGAALFTEVDIRYNSKTFGQHYQTVLSEENKRILWAPAGFANGFLTLEEETEVVYKCTALWNPIGEGTIRWNDPDLNINWTTESPILSEKDSTAMTFQHWKSKPESKLFTI